MVKHVQLDGPQHRTMLWMLSGQVSDANCSVDIKKVFYFDDFDVLLYGLSPWSGVFKLINTENFKETKVI